MKVRLLAEVLVCCDDKVLILKRSGSVKLRPEQWDLPGGHSDADESGEEAAVRELKEESDIDVERSQLTLVYSQTKMVTEDLCVHWLTYVTRVTDMPAVTLSHEHSDYQWVSLTDATRAIEYPVKREALNFVFDNGLSKASYDR